MKLAGVRASSFVVAVALLGCVPAPSSVPTIEPALPTPAPTTAQSPVTPSAEPTDEPLRGLPAGAFSTPDAIVVAWIEDWPSFDDETRDQWRLNLEVIPRTGPSLEGAYLIRPPVGWEPLRDYTMV